MFGKDMANMMSVYQHSHNHDHDHGHDHDFIIGEKNI